MAKCPYCSCGYLRVNWGGEKWSKTILECPECGHRVT